ncbi:MAG TPA: adenylate/guanylate cyclase domain-containing protein [Beijerinckiaceae bacterium]
MRLSTTLTLTTLLSAMLCLALSFTEPYPVRALRDLVFDSYQRMMPRAHDPASPVRIVALDDESLARLGQWPWPRETLAKLVDTLSEAGAATVALDVLLAEAERGDEASAGDQALAGAIGRGRVVLGLALSNRGGAPDVKPGFATAGDDARDYAPRFVGALQPLPILRDAASGLGAMNWTPDRDLVVREVPTLLAVDAKLVPSFAIEALRVAQGASTLVVKSSNASGETALGRQTGITSVKVGDLTVPTSGNGTVRIHYSGRKPDERIPAWRIVTGTFDRASVEGAIVLVGATAAALQDLRATPLEAGVPGIDLHAEVIESLISGVHLTRPDWMRGLESLLIVLGSFVAVVAATRLTPAVASWLVSGLLTCLAAGSFGSFAKLGILVDPVWPMLGLAGPFAIATLGIYRQSELSRRMIRDAFARYVSPAVVETLAQDPGRLRLGGETRELTVLFSDVRGFTSRSESLSAEEVVSFLNRVHTPMTDHVLETGGTLDKFIGDGMMAFWNAPLDHPDPVRAALRCALSMRDSLAQLNAELGPGGEPIGLGIGLHKGPACVGNVGSVRRFDYSAIGDTVNTAARIEPLCKPYGVSILVSAEIAEAAPDFATLPVGDVQLRGQQRLTTLFALHGGPEALTPAFLTYRESHEAALALVRAGAPEALVALKACADDPLAGEYQKVYANLITAWRERAAAAPAEPAAALSGAS